MINESDSADALTSLSPAVVSERLALVAPGRPMLDYLPVGLFGSVMGVTGLGGVAAGARAVRRPGGDRARDPRRGHRRLSPYGDRLHHEAGDRLPRRPAGVSSPHRRQPLRNGPDQPFAFEPPLPAALQPSLLILVAPFAVGYSTYTVTVGRTDLFAEALYALTLFVLADLFGRLRTLPGPVRSASPGGR